METIWSAKSHCQHRHTFHGLTQTSTTSTTQGSLSGGKTAGALNRQPNNISNIRHFTLSLPYVRVWSVTLAFNWTFGFTAVSLLSELLIWFVQSGKMFLIPVAIEWCGLVASKPDLCSRFQKSIHEVYIRPVCSLFCPDSNQTTCVKYQTRQPRLLSSPNRSWIHVSRSFKTSCSHLLH